MTILAHIKAERDVQQKEQRHHDAPEDCIMAKGRVPFCEQVMDRLRGLDEEAALSELKKIRSELRNRVDGYASIKARIFNVTDTVWFEAVVDQVAKENTGWIEVSTSGSHNSEKRALMLPKYRRKLSNTHLVDTIKRQKDESDDVWLERREQWLSKYHPDVPVEHEMRRLNLNVRETVSYGTIAEFMKLRHLIENDLRAYLFFMDNECRFKMVDVYSEYKDGLVGEIRQTSGLPLMPGAQTICGYPLKLVA